MRYRNQLHPAGRQAESDTSELNVRYPLHSTHTHRENIPHRNCNANFVLTNTHHLPETIRTHTDFNPWRIISS